jgi:hypothetical protein
MVYFVVFPARDLSMAVRIGFDITYFRFKEWRLTACHSVYNLRLA